MHMTTRVTGTLKEDRDAIDAPVCRLPGGDSFRGTETPGL